MNKKLYLKVGAIIMTVAMVFCAIFGNQINAVETGTEPGVEVSEQAPEAETNPEANPDANQEAVDLTGQDVGHAVIDLNADKASPQQEISSWKWVDPDQVLTDSKLIIPNASADQLLTREVLDTMLPKAILAMVNGTEVEVPLVWDYINYPTNGAYEGVYIINALHKDYVLAKDVPQVSVTVQFESNQISTMAVDDSKYQVPGISPFGTTINLFDYWVEDPRDKDFSSQAGDLEKGINKNHDLDIGHQLHFVAGKNDKTIIANQWTHSENPCEGIVKNTLENGYPMLRPSTSTGITKEESLDYLFDVNKWHGQRNPKPEKPDKQSFANVKNLLQVDGEGYYYYDSELNYAEFDEGANSFKLYNKPAVNPGGGYPSGKEPKGQFFPFDKGEEVFNETSNGIVKKTDVLGSTGTLNHFFGMTMSTRFIHQDHGTIDGKPDSLPVIYKFSGDDDVWVFIDGILVADLGGIHNRAELEIDFSTGDITINGQTNDTLRSKLDPNGKKPESFIGNTFLGNTVHKLDFFYLERGHTDSNLFLKFNLVTIPQSEVVKTDELGKAVPGAEFELYNADKNYNIINKTPLASGITGADGTFVLTNDKNQIVTLDNLYNKEPFVRYMVLKEKKVPDGYRKPYGYRMASNEAIKLQLVAKASSNSADGTKNSIVVKCVNTIETGTFASAKVLTTAPDEIEVFDNKNPTTTVRKKVGDGKLFAVVMKYMGASDGSEINDVTKWKPVSGNALEGWDVEPGHSFADILNSAKKNPHVFIQTPTKTFEAEINNLPGDILNYFYMVNDGANTKKDQVKYSIGYFWVPGDSLDTARAEEIKRVKHDGFTRKFSTKLFVPNIENALYVQKVDANRKLINKPATFELYKAEHVTVGADGVATLKPGAVAYDTVTTGNYQKPTDVLNLGSAGRFPTNKNVTLVNGTYYIREKTPPTGYVATSNLIKVEVTDRGVYADAGKANDEVRVKTGIGAVMKSLLQFTNGNVNSTLAEVIATLKEGNTHTNLALTDHKMYSKFVQNQQDAGKYLADMEYQKIHYDTNCNDPNNLNKANKHENHLFITDVGYSDLDIKQWYGNTSNPTPGIPDENKTKLDKDLSHLFSKTVVVEVANAVYIPDSTDLHIKKIVEPAELVDPNETFDFTVEFSHENNGSGEFIYKRWSNAEQDNRKPNVIKTALNSIDFIKNQVNQNYVISEHEINPPQDVMKDGLFGKYKYSTIYFGYTYRVSFSLKPNEELVIKGLPEGTKYTITETVDTNKYTTNIKEVNDSFLSTDHVQNIDGTTIKGQLAKEAIDSRIEDFVLFTNKTKVVPLDFEFIKVNQTGDPLSGAEFKLFELNCTNNGHSHGTTLVDVSNPGTCWNTVGTYTSATDGKVVLKGLIANKTYRLVETKAPGGYVLPKGQWDLVLNNDGSVKSITKVGNTNDTPAFEHDQQTGAYKLLNFKPNDLPLTGGRMNKLHFLFGLTVMLLGIALAIKAYHKKLNLNDM